MTISILSEIPEPLHQALGRYLAEHKTLDLDQFVTVAIASLLAQSGDQDAARVYLESLWGVRDEA